MIKSKHAIKLLIKGYHDLFNLSWGNGNLNESPLKLVIKNILSHHASRLILQNSKLNSCTIFSHTPTQTFD